MRAALRVGSGAEERLAAAAGRRLGCLSGGMVGWRAGWGGLGGGPCGDWDDWPVGRAACKGGRAWWWWYGGSTDVHTTRKGEPR